jgi:hypothetical protein
MTELEIFKEHNQVLFALYILPLYHRLSSEQLRCRPNSRLNSVAWNLWHTTRAEDLGVNRLLTDGVQVLDEDHWYERLNLPYRQIGTGMTKDQVDELNRLIDLSALHDYQQAVHAKTTRIIEDLPEATLNEKLDAVLLKRVLHDGETLHPGGEWVYDVYLNQTKGWLLFHVGLNHHYFHLGDSLAIISLTEPSSH